MSDPNPQSQAGAKVRLITGEDLPWTAEVTAHAYPGLIKDWDGFYRWAEMAIQHKDLLCIRTDHAFLVAGLQRFFYDPSKILGIAIHYASEQTAPWDMVALVRTGARWAGARGAEDFEISSTTGIDPRALAHRVGSMTERAVYCIKVSHERPDT